MLHEFWDEVRNNAWVRVNVVTIEMSSARIWRSMEYSHVTKILIREYLYSVNLYEWGVIMFNVFITGMSPGCSNFDYIKYNRTTVVRLIKSLRPAVCLSICLSVFMQEIIHESLNEFAWNLVLTWFTKLCLNSQLKLNNNIERFAWRPNLLHKFSLY
jgi:hypothetical protein